MKNLRETKKIMTVEKWRRNMEGLTTIKYITDNVRYKILMKEFEDCEKSATRLNRTKKL